MKKFSDRNENHGQNGKEKKSDFKSILQKVCDKEMLQDMECKTLGYTKDAVPCVYIYKTREYVK